MVKVFIPAFALCLLLFLNRCANPVSPSGGPKDVDPPVVTGSQPDNNTVQFKEKTIRLDFDEFVNVDESPSKIIISPPPSTKPDFRLRGKSLVIALQDTLLPQTTYIIQLIGAVSDITENNVQPQYTYLFSTGTFVDSLQLKGRVIDAFTLRPLKDIAVMLYPMDMDTIPPDSFPVKIKPWYLTLSDDNGEFNFKGLSSKPFKLVALEDQSGDLLFNQISERIAYSDTLVSGYPIAPAVSDSLVLDTIASDTARIDSASQKIPIIRAVPVLSLFAETDTVQDLLKDELLRNQVLRLVFKNPLRDYRIRIFDSLGESVPRYQELNTRRDTLMVWLEQKPGDTLFLGISDTGMPEDTIDLSITRKEAGRKPRKSEAAAPPTLEMTTNARGGQLNQFKANPVLTFGLPLKEYRFDGIIVNDNKDTIQPVFSFVDSLNRKLMMTYPWQEGKFYRILIPDSSFISVSGLSHDTIRTSFKTVAMKDLGSLALSINMEKKPGNYIIQLLTEKETILEEQFISADKKVEFRFLQPGKYKVKAIFDRNNNRKWDTGNYKQKLQPEELVYFPRTIEVRANWDVEEPWSL